MPGAEGAEAVRVVWEKDLVLEEAGTMRRDYRGERSFSDSPGERRGAGSTREEGGTYHLGQSILVSSGETPSYGCVIEFGTHKMMGSWYRRRLGSGVGVLEEVAGSCLMLEAHLGGRLRLASRSLVRCCAVSPQCAGACLVWVPCHQ
jgi:hypothetical protein